ncbi:MAG: beta-N-acetylhexosaminidase [Proteobacteria bacterium]|nr:beta-N-acetylhexosaminidase [Pseudomonadota bacterium]
MTEPKAVIFGCQGTKLSDEEKRFFERTQPLGFILFTRNCHHPEQVYNLIQELKSCIAHPDVAILIDQEGGTVQRLHPPHWRSYPPMAIYGDIAEDDLELAEKLVYDHFWLIGQELSELGINVNCAPVVDLITPGENLFIGERSFSDQVDVVADLAAASIRALRDSGILPIIKHLPGHGRSKQDSHKELPIIYTSLEELSYSDFQAFHLVCEQFLPQDMWGMTGHLLFHKIDEQNPVSTSSFVIDSIIKEHIQFKGLLISDCITMNALSGSIGKRARAVQQAGCDIVLHCKGSLDEMIEVSANVEPLKAFNKYQESFKNLQNSTKKVRQIDTVWLDLQDALEPFLGDMLLCKQRQV